MFSRSTGTDGRGAHQAQQQGAREGRRHPLSAGRVALLLALPILVSCGGGGSDCKRTTAEFDLRYEPKKARQMGGVRDVLTYRLGEAKEWRITLDGYTQACLGGLRASLQGSRPTLPQGIELDTASGTLRTKGMTVHAEGYCAGDQSSIQRRCPSGSTFRARSYGVVITTDHFVEAIPVVVTFEPEE